MGVLPRREVTVEFGHILEHGDAGKRLHDLEDFLDLRLHVDERRLAPVSLEGFSGGGEDTQTSAANELQIYEVKDEVLNGASQDGRKLAFEVGSRRGVETAIEFDRNSARVLIADVSLDLDVETHKNFWFRLRIRFIQILICCSCKFSG
jgi:hypothetical protein